jgi:hypothetical protein
MHGRERHLPVTKVRVNVAWLPSALPSRHRPRVWHALHVRRRGWISGPASDESSELFHAIDSRPVRWTGPEAGDWSPESAVGRDRASGLVSSLVISVAVSRSPRVVTLKPVMHRLHSDRTLLIGQLASKIISSLADGLDCSGRPYFSRRSRDPCRSSLVKRLANSSSNIWAFTVSSSLRCSHKR